jgi:hypothetical protein
MKSRLSILFYLIIIQFFITSCNENENRFTAELNDSAKQAIISYARENKIDLRSKVITTDWVVNDYRTDIYISNLNTQLYKKRENTPVYFSVVNDSIIVFIYAGVEKVISRNTDKIISEIDKTLVKHKVQLNPDSGHFYRAPTWLYTSCGEKNRIEKKLPPLEYNFIPCGYTLMQDTVRKDSLYVLKEKINPPVPKSSR